MKKCTKCKVEKSLEFFNKRKSSKDGYASQCSECNKKNLKTHYLKNKERYLNRNRKKRLELSEWFNNFKKSLKCSSCNESRWWVLDFHHRNPKEKDGYLYSMLINRGKKKFEQELEKCDVLCANCHRDVHFNPDYGDNS